MLFIDQLRDEAIGNAEARAALLRAVDTAAARASWNERRTIDWVDEVLRLRPDLAVPPADVAAVARTCACGYAPPFDAALVGKPQIFPNPTAEPDAAIKKPNLDVNSPLGADIYLFLFCYSSF